MTEKPDSGWHLDKRVPIALILVIMGQTATGAWWAATTSARVDANASAILKVDNIPERLARIEAQQTYVLETLKRIDRNMEKAQ